MKILRGTIFGGIAYFILGWIVYGKLLTKFMETNSNTCANRPAEEMIWWAIILSNLVLGLFLTLVLNWTGAKGVVNGLKTGVLFGLLFALTMDLSMYSMTTMYNFTFLIIDTIVFAILMAIVGLVIVLTWGKNKV